MKTREFKEFLKISLLKGYEPVTNHYGFKNLENRQIEAIIDKLPNFELDKSFIELIEYYYDVIEDMPGYESQAKLLKIARDKYGESLYDNYQYARNKKNNKNDKKLYKIGEKCYNMKYKEELAKIDIDIEAVKMAMRMTETTQEKLAKLLKISSRSIHRKLNEDSQFTASEILKIMRLFDLSIDDVIKNDE